MTPKRNYTKKFVGSYFFVIFLTFFAVMVGFSYIRTYYRDYQIKSEIVGLQQQAMQMKTKKSALLEELTYVQSSLFVEEIAKTELNLAKAGENVIMMNNSNTQALQYGQQKNSMIELTNNNNYAKWLRVFFATE